MHLSHDDNMAGTSPVGDGGGGWKGALSLSKDLLPWIMVIFQLIYSYGVKNTTSDRIRAQQEEDHTSLKDLRDQMNKILQNESALGAKLDCLLNGCRVINEK